MKYLFLVISPIILVIIGFILHSRQSINQASLYSVIASEAQQGEARQSKAEKKIAASSRPTFSKKWGGSPRNDSDEPIAKFSSRITKKPFGVYITPETSPIQPDRWTGYHTGVDVEYEDVLEDVPIRAIADGEIVLSKFATGYGGVVVIRHNISGPTSLKLRGASQDILALYGHLDPQSLPSKNIKEVKQGQIIGVLGDGYTEETDGARKHLHFAVLKQAEIDIRGYVKIQEELAGWYDPEEFYRAK